VESAHCSGVTDLSKMASETRPRKRSSLRDGERPGELGGNAHGSKLELCRSPPLASVKIREKKRGGGAPKTIGHRRESVGVYSKIGKRGEICWLEKGGVPRRKEKIKSTVIEKRNSQNPEEAKA